jgi:hypothetical protein
MMRKTLVFIVLLMAMVLSACNGQATPAASSGSTAPQPVPASLPVKAEATQMAQQSPDLPEIEIDAKDYSYAAPETLTAGWVRVILTNSGKEPHHVQFLRLNDGVTAQQFEDALKQAEGPALAMTKQVGGVGAVHPGGTASAVLNLPAGDYVILCLIPSASDHVAHHAKGMIMSLTVKPGNEAAAAEPRAGMTIHMKDFSYDLPSTLPAGKYMIKVVNDGPEPHELNILQLAEGKTLDDVTNFLGGAGGPPPFTPVGGMNGLDVGVTGYAELDLQPGNYVAICNIPSPKAEGHPHFTLGMIKAFTVPVVASGFPTGRFVQSDNSSRALEFTSDSSFKALDGENQLAAATFKVNGDIFTETSNDASCETNVSFKYTFDGINLRFFPVTDLSTDTCQGRKADFNPAITWVLAK